MTVLPSRIAFGSCNNQDLQNNLWPIIERRKPAGFVWGGDSIYADLVRPIDWRTFPPTIGSLECADGNRLRRLYEVQQKVPGYKSLVDSNATIFGTIDDHDYGCDNADRTYPYRIESAEAFVDFIGEPKDSAMTKRAKAGLGVYGVKVFDFDRPQGRQALSDSEAGIDHHAVVDHGDPPSYSNKSVAVFVLDVRSNKSPWKKGLHAFTPDLDGDFLGETQWEWFEASLSRSRAAINVVVNGLQVHANIFPDGNMAESWGKYPKSQQRLFDALLQDSVSAPILISGDVHMAQFMRKDCRRDIGKSHFRPLVEMTTSGMTHSWGSLPSNPVDSPDWKPTAFDRYGSFIAASMMGVLNSICPWTDVMLSNRSDASPKPVGNLDLAESGGAESAKTGRQFSLQKNFGELEFDWDTRTVVMRAIGEGDKPLLSAKWTMDQLSGRTLMPGSFVAKQDYAYALDDALVDGVWTCVNHRGRVNETHHLIGHLVTASALILLVPLPYLLFTYLLLSVTRKYRTRLTMHRNCSPPAVCE